MILEYLPNNFLLQYSSQTTYNKDFGNSNLSVSLMEFLKLHCSWYCLFWIKKVKYVEN